MQYTTDDQKCAGQVLEIKAVFYNRKNTLGRSVNLLSFTFSTVLRQKEEEKKKKEGKIGGGRGGT